MEEVLITRSVFAILMKDLELTFCCYFPQPK